jgi:TolB protein
MDLGRRQVKDSSGRRGRRGLAVLIALGALGVAATANADVTASLVSQNSAGEPANDFSGTSIGGGLSDDGHLVVFDSRATNLPGGNGDRLLTYVHNTESGKTGLMAKTSRGTPSLGAAVAGGISADGRFVVFEGTGVGLPGAQPETTEVWIHDRRTGQTKLVSKTNDGQPGTGGDSVEPKLSADGRYVSFVSEADNLSSGGGDVPRIYVRDVKLHETRLVSRTNAGKPVSGFGGGQSISGDGSRVVFASPDPKLPPDDGFRHIYVRDLDQSRTRILDRTSNEELGQGDAGEPSISADGRFVAFNSEASNFPGVTPPDAQEFLRDTELGTLRLVSRNNSGQPSDGDGLYGQPSGNGRFVTFQAQATNLPGSDPIYEQAYVRDMRTETTRLLSGLSGGGDDVVANDDSGYTSISRDGRWASFESVATNLGGDPTHYQAFRAGPIR